MEFASGESPSPKRMGFASWGSPLSRGFLLQVNEIHLKELPLSTANGIRFRGVPFFKENGILIKGIPSPQRMGFASKDSPSPQRMGFASIASPSLREWGSHQEGPLSKANGIRIKRVTLPKTNEFRTKGSPSPSEWDSHQEGHPLQSEWASLLTSDLVAERDPFQGILLQGHATQGIPFSKGFRLCV